MNKHPVISRGFIAARFKKSAANIDQPLAKKPYCIKLPQTVDDWIRQKPDNATYMRKLLLQAMEQELREERRKANPYNKRLKAEKALNKHKHQPSQEHPPS